MSEVRDRMQPLDAADPAICGLITREIERQENGLELIASENFVSRAVLEAMGSVLTNKYAEGYPGRRYYGGCEVVDEIEQLAIDRALELFAAEHANVQPHSGAQANMAAYLAVLEPGETIMGLKLPHGGHLTHGAAVNASGRLFHAVQYGVDEETGRIDLDQVREIARAERPRVIIAGGSAYPRNIDFTLRGPRGGFILCREPFAKPVDKQVFPGTQGGPLEHVVAAKAVAFAEALTPEFKVYAAQVVKNAQAMGETLIGRGYRLVSGGTDTHLLLVDLRSEEYTGKEAEEALGRAGIHVNKNTVPGDPRSPFVTSGIRIGSSALTTRGMAEEEMRRIAGLIDDVLRSRDDATVQRVAGEVRDLAAAFPLYSSLARI
jgi:glycine hydroxymethyltransferase